MDPDTEVESIFRQGNEEEVEDEEEEKKKRERPPSSYGSMKSDSEDMEEEEEEYEEDDVAEACPSPVATAQPETTDHETTEQEAIDHDVTGMQLYRSDSPETLYTMTTQQTKPPGAMVIDTRSSDLEGNSDDDEEDADEVLVCDSPEPPEPVEPDDAVQNDLQPGRLHPEQDLPYIFKAIQNKLTGLTREELYKFKMWFYQWEPGITLQQVMEGDILDFVDRIIEILGQDRALLHTISTLENVNKKVEASELRTECRRALTRFHLKQYLIRKHQVIREGVVRAGKQNLLDNVYVEPEISTCGYGGVEPFHEFRSSLPTPIQVPSADTFVGVNNLFRQQKEDGQPVRTVVTTGLPGIGMTVSVGKFALDWAELRANRDLQFVIKLSFRTFWHMRSKDDEDTQYMSIVEVIEYYHPECKDTKYLSQEDCKFLIIMDSFDCYQTSLDFENSPVINDNYTKAHPDVLVVNIIRGTVLRGARVWILGRRAAVTQIPSKYIDVFTEIQGFSEVMIDEYLTKRFSDKSVAAKIVAHYKRQPTLRSFARQPFLCWMLATVFERCFRYPDYGVHPPRVTPFYINIMIVQMNRRLQFYYGKGDHDLKWSAEDKLQLTKMGKMAFKMLEKNTSVFYDDDVKEYGLKLTEVTVLSGMCTELSTADGRRTYCFTHFPFQEFMAALYVFTTFRTDGKNVLESGLHMPKIFTSKDQTKSAVGLVHCALERTFAAPLGDYDMFLRFLCGLLSPECHDEQLSGCLFRHNAPKVGGLDEVQRLLEKTIQSAPENRVENLKECLREMTQEDD